MTCHLLSYGRVASHVAVRARAQLLKEADSRSNRVGSRRGAVWSARAARARSAFWAADFGDAEAAAAAGAGGGQDVTGTRRCAAGASAVWLGLR